MIDQKLADFITTAESKALATFSTVHGLNVVPVSTITIRDGNIILMNYFMGKTLENLNSNNSVALACWKGLEGIQIKATVTYQEQGNLFNEMKLWIAEILPTRILKGILILAPTEVFDTSASAEKAGTKIY